MRKLLCLTRSSDQLIQQLPAQYPSNSRTSSPKTEDCLRQLVTDSHEGLVVHRISQQSSFSLLNDNLVAFCQLDSQHTMLLVVRYQEVSVSVVNHLRMLVEEAENHVRAGARKLFVLLIHYPQSSTSSNRLALFSSGWDLHFLDTIGRNVETSVADVTNWLKSCCGLEPLRPNIQDGRVPYDAFVKVSSRLSFANKSDKASIIEKILSKDVSSVLVKQFASYWSGDAAEGLLRDIMRAHCDDLAIGLHDRIQDKLRELFLTFACCMALQMNEGSNLDLLISDHHPSHVCSLFIQLLTACPLPTLGELEGLRDHLPMKQAAVGMTPRFPFFVLVSSSVEVVYQRSRRDLNQLQHHCNGTGDYPLSLLRTLDPGVATPMVDEVVGVVSRKLQEVR